MKRKLELGGQMAERGSAEAGNAEWMTVRLGDVVEIERSGVDPSSLPQDCTYLGLEHIDSNGRVQFGETIADHDVKSTKFRFDSRHVLFGKLRPYLRKTARPGFSGVCSTDILPLLPSDRVDRDYLYHWLRTDEIVLKSTQACSGANLPRLSPQTLRAFEFRVPRSVAEQQRIAGILDAADALRAKRRAALAQLDALAQALFLDRFGDPVTNPKGWEVRALKATKTKVQIGPFGSLLHKDDYVSGGIPLINPMHIVAGRIRVGADQTVSERKASTLNGYRLEAGDVIMGRRGEMGRCAIVSETESGMLCGTGSLFLRPDCREFSSVFLAWTLSSESMKRHLEGLSQGVTMANLNRTMIENLSIGIPPLPLQQSFAAAVEAIERQKARHREQLAGLDALFASLQHRAFRGEL